MLRKAIADIQKKHMKSDVPELRAGDSVRVHTKIKEGDKERIQIFEGTVIAFRKGGTGSTFTVRKVSYGVGVERIFPLHSPRLDRIEVVGHGEVRRAKLFYLRELQGKAARLTQSGRAAAGPRPPSLRLTGTPGPGRPPTQGRARRCRCAWSRGGMSRPTAPPDPAPHEPFP